MRILYAVQGTGNGHLARAREIIPHLKAHGEVDVLVSGQHAEVNPGQEPAYRCKGLGFIFGKAGGIDIMQTWAKNRIRRFYKEVKALPILDYDLVINDFEPVSAWACKLKGKPCWGLSHQAAVLHPAAPQPESSDLIGQLVLQHYAPVSEEWGFHFKPYAARIFSPVIRSEVRALDPTDGEEIVVYLPAYGDEKIVKVLSQVYARFQVFSKHARRAYRVGNIRIQPIENEAFLNAMAASAGVLCGAGFETPAEAMYLGKKVMAIPMKNQFEQQCNAAALADLGVPTLKNLKEKRVKTIQDWADEAGGVPDLPFPDQTAGIIEKILSAAALVTA